MARRAGGRRVLRRFGLDEAGVFEGAVKRILARAIGPDQQTLDSEHAARLAGPAPPHI